VTVVRAPNVDPVIFLSEVDHPVCFRKIKGKLEEKCVVVLAFHYLAVFAQEKKLNIAVPTLRRN